MLQAVEGGVLMRHLKTLFASLDQSFEAQDGDLDEVPVETSLVKQNKR